MVLAIQDSLKIMSKYPAFVDDNDHEIDISDKIEHRCENCSFWYRRFCTHHGCATFPEGLCEYYKMSKILPSK